MKKKFSILNVKQILLYNSVKCLKRSNTEKEAHFLGLWCEPVFYLGWWVTGYYAVIPEATYIFLVPCCRD
jgi:hypothetical protein